jgi:Domain of unknown function (DUF5659)
MEATAEYRTTDVHLGAFLLARGHRLVRMDRLKDGRRAQFVFASGQEDVEKFFLNAQIPARDFAAALKTLKAALHAL